MRPSHSLVNLLDPTVTGLGYELVGIEFDGKQRVLRVYIDNVGGITLDDCSLVSSHISALLDVEEPISGHYQLEISSPGLNRPLFTIGHFERFLGEMAHVHLLRLVEGRRTLKAKIIGVEGNMVVLQEGEKMFHVPHETIEKARLIPNFTF